MKQAIVLYMPVLHKGYLAFLEKYAPDARELFILGDEFVGELSAFHKEIRALDPEITMRLIVSLGLFSRVEVLRPDSINSLADCEIIAPDEEISRRFISAYLPDGRVRYDSVFLRWDEKRVKSDAVVNHSRVSEDPFDREMTGRASAASEKSSDWWRHVGAVAVRSGKMLYEDFNHHVPSEHMPYANGDPRDVIEAGTMNLLYTSIHAEQSVIARAAADGVSLKDAGMYLNIFPCPLCAKLMAYAGIKTCFFKQGSAWLDAESILKAKGVEIVLVK